MITISFSYRFYKNKRIISQSCRRYINHIESFAPGNPCDEELMRHIIRYMDENKDFVSAQRESDSDYVVIIKKLVAKISYDMIASRVYYGINIDYVHKAILKDLLSAGYISQREYDEDLNSLKQICDERVPEIYKEYYESERKMEEAIKHFKEHNVEEDKVIP